MKYVKIKRFTDCLIASVAVIILSPLFVLIAIIVRLDSTGPIIFKQKRSGLNKKPFTLYKFRSMELSAPANAPTSTLLLAEVHITRVGRILRKLSLDELPQLINIIKGDMSIVGPRPVVMAETDLINEREKYGANDARPGLSGWAQVNGRDDLSYRKKAKLDGWYVKNVSFLLDLKCIVRTFKVVIMQEGHTEGYRKHDDHRSDEKIEMAQ